MDYRGPFDSIHSRIPTPRDEREARGLHQSGHRNKRAHFVDTGLPGKRGPLFLNRAGSGATSERTEPYGTGGTGTHPGAGVGLGLLEMLGQFTVSPPAGSAGERPVLVPVNGLF